MKILGIDVCSGFCSVAIAVDGHAVTLVHEPMTRGHAERLAPMVSEVLGQAGLTATDLDGIAVTTGPGSFTGARLGVSFARGLALAVGCPATGVSVFEAVAADLDGDVIVALPGKNGSVLLQHFRNGQPVTPPAEHSTDAGLQTLPPATRFTVVGSAADLLFDSASQDVQARATISATDPITALIVAKIGAERLARGEAVLPTPLYLRPPDAKPQAAAALG